MSAPKPVSGYPTIAHFSPPPSPPPVEELLEEFPTDQQISAFNDLSERATRFIKIATEDLYPLSPSFEEYCQRMLGPAEFGPPTTTHIRGLPPFVERPLIRAGEVAGLRLNSTHRLTPSQQALLEVQLQKIETIVARKMQQKETFLKKQSFINTLESRLDGLNANPNYDDAKVVLERIQKALTVQKKSFSEEELQHLGNLQKQATKLCVRGNPLISKLRTALISIEPPNAPNIVKAQRIVDRIQRALTEQRALFLPAEIQEMEEIQKRADDLIPESPAARTYRMLRPFLLESQAILKHHMTATKATVSQVLGKYRESNVKRSGEQLTKALWKKAGQPTIEHFGSRVLRGDGPCKMTPQDIVAVLSQSPDLKLRKLAVAISQETHLTHTIYDQFYHDLGISPQMQQNLALFAYKLAGGEPKVATKDKITQGIAILRGDLFVDFRVIQKTFAHFNESLQKSAVA